MKKAYLISDNEFLSGTHERLRAQLASFFIARGFEIEETLVSHDLAYCQGCFGCWVKSPGECVIHDEMAHINRTAMTSDVVVYLCPVIFGQFSANMKNAIDRWLPNMLPFFIIRTDGSTMHPPRYKSYPKQLIIGYGDDINAEDAALFADITGKHRVGVDTFIFEGEIDAYLEKADLQRVEGSL